MSKLLIVGLIFWALFLSISAGAVGKITVDPNAGPQKASVETISGSDLTQKVIYEARRKTVSSILSDLSKMTGVTLMAGYNNEDWQVRDRRMNIFAKDVPLSNLHQLHCEGDEVQMEQKRKGRRCQLSALYGQEELWSTLRGRVLLRRSVSPS